MLYLSKVAALFVTPLGASLTIAFTGVALLVAGWRRSGVSLVLGALLALWIASTPLVSHLALGALERQYPIRRAAETQSADVAIILGGALSPATPPRREADLGDAADRVVFAGALVSVDQLVGHGHGEGVELGRTLQREREHSVVDLPVQGGVVHRCRALVKGGPA